MHGLLFRLCGAPRWRILDSILACCALLWNEWTPLIQPS
jgi:hypothetical protein